MTCGVPARIQPGYGLRPLLPRSLGEALTFGEGEHGLQSGDQLAADEVNFVPAGS